MNSSVRMRRRRGAANYLPSVTSVGDGAANWPLGGPDIHVKYRAVAELKLPKRQLRTHSKKQVAQIEAMIRRAGFINPIIIDGDLTIVAGVGRYLAAKELKLSRVPTIKVDHLSEAELRAYAIADNKLVLNDGWNEELLTVEISELMSLDFDLPIELTGFDTVEIDNLIIGTSKKAARQQADEIVEPGDGAPVSRVGDLFELGDHRLSAETPDRRRAIAR